MDSTAFCGTAAAVAGVVVRRIDGGGLTATGITGLFAGIIGLLNFAAAGGGGGAGVNLAEAFSST
jgi:hypothetical protein